MPERLDHDAPSAGTLAARGWFEAPDEPARVGRFTATAGADEDFLCFAPTGGTTERFPWFQVNFVRLCEHGSYPPDVPDNRAAPLREWPDPTTIVGAMSGGSRWGLGYFVFGLVPEPPHSEADWLDLFDEHGVQIAEDDE